MVRTPIIVSIKPLLQKYCLQYGVAEHGKAHQLSRVFDRLSQPSIVVEGVPEGLFCMLDRCLDVHDFDL